MTVVSIATGRQHQRPEINTEAGAKLIDALLELADNRRDLAGSSWETIVAGFGGALDDIADNLRHATEYEHGLTDHEATSRRKAEARAAELRIDARHTASWLASWLLTGAAS